MVGGLQSKATAIRYQPFYIRYVYVLGKRLTASSTSLFLFVYSCLSAQRSLVVWTQNMFAEPPAP
jgi:hypothetical protein